MIRGSICNSKGRKTVGNNIPRPQSHIEYPRLIAFLTLIMRNANLCSCCSLVPHTMQPFGNNTLHIHITIKDRNTKYPWNTEQKRI